MQAIENIIGQDEAKCLRSDFNDAIMNGAGYGEVEDLLLGYGLEMDYLEQLLW